MKSFTTKKLIDNLSAKGIIFKTGEKILFQRNDYFQIVNAYKSLFILKVENIHDIMRNINNNLEIDRYKKNFQISNYSDNNSLKNKICNKIITKYGLNCTPTQTLGDKIKTIEKIKYLHHVYKPNTYYGDFVRMFNFEHELRTILLKNTLIIEENIKRIFISVLNNEENIDSNFLANINNYNVTATGFTKPLESLSKIIKLQGNTNSKPIKRKIDQEIIVPYWILINEMTLNQTITTIKNLNETIKYKILQSCFNEFTSSFVDIFDSSKNNQTIENEKKNIHIFTKILTYVGYFRNMLAHNQPIYNYNVKDTDLTSFPNISYDEPKIRNSNNVNDQYQRNAATMLKLREFYGPDFFNGRNYQVNIDLSWIIYVISKIIKQINPKSDFGEDIRNIYKKYNLLIYYNESTILDMKALIDLKTMALEINVNDINAASLIELIDNNKAYKSQLKSDIAYLKTTINEIKKGFGNIKIVRKKSDYKPFTNTNEYKKYTNIDNRFLMLI